MVQFSQAWRDFDRSVTLFKHFMTHLLGKGWCLLEKIHGVEKHMSGESFVSNLDESFEIKREDP